MNWKNEKNNITGRKQYRITGGVSRPVMRWNDEFSQCLQIIINLA